MIGRRLGHEKRSLLSPGHFRLFWILALGEGEVQEKVLKRRKGTKTLRWV